MPATNINVRDLKDKGHIKVLSGNEYITVQGRLYLAHSSGQLIGIETEELYPDDPDFITIKATATIFNPIVIAQLEQISDTKKLSDEAKVRLIESITESALTSYYTGLARSKRRGGKSAEGTNPLEVAETSAVGRALGNAGFGDTESFASFEEIMIAMSRDGSEPEPAPAKKRATKKPADPNAPTKEQKQVLFDLASERLGITTVEEFTTKIEAMDEAQGKKVGAFTVDDIARLKEALEKIPPF